MLMISGRSFCLPALTATMLAGQCCSETGSQCGEYASTRVAQWPVQRPLDQCGDRYETDAADESGDDPRRHDAHHTVTLTPPG
jgi:hypothetical protein